MTSEQKELKAKMQSERSKKSELSSALKEEHRRHNEQYDSSREPLLNGLTSEFDLKLFRDAQMLACEQLVRSLVKYITSHKPGDHLCGKPV